MRFIHIRIQPILQRAQDRHSRDPKTKVQIKKDKRTKLTELAMVLSQWITYHQFILTTSFDNSELMPQKAFTVLSIDLHRGNKELGRRAACLLNLHRRVNQPGEHEACVESYCTRQGKE